MSIETQNFLDVLEGPDEAELERIRVELLREELNSDEFIADADRRLAYTEYYDYDDYDWDDDL